MAIANWTCVSFCNQPKARYLAISRDWRESRRYAVCGCRHLATLRESKAHFGLPWVRPWDYRSKCYMDGKRIQCLSNASQLYVPIYLQPFPSNSTRNIKSSPFYHVFLHILASPGYAPGTVTVNVTWIEREFNAGQTPRSIYPSIFNRFWDIASYWLKIATFSYPTSV